MEGHGPGAASEAVRLEAVWAGEFGDAYTERNRGAGAARERFWRALLEECPARRVLEVGSNLGANLTWIASDERLALGIDVNLTALGKLREAAPAARGVAAAGRTLPFRDGAFDLVFTIGVLIHQPPETLPTVMAEIVRCSRRFVLCGEYYAPAPVEVPYRGQSGALLKRDFGGFYRERHPELTLRRQAFLSRADGWDDVTVWVFEKGAG